MKTRWIWLSLLLSSFSWSIDGGLIEESIVDPTDMENYDPVSKTMKTKHKSANAILKNYLQKILNDVQQLGIIDDNHEEHHFNADLVLTSQTLAEIAKFLNDEDWDPVALERSLKNIFSQFKHHHDSDVKENIVFLVIIYIVLLMHSIDWLQQLHFFIHLTCVISILLVMCQCPWISFFTVFPVPAHQENPLKQNKDFLKIYFMDLRQLSLSTVVISFVLKMCYCFGKWIMQPTPPPKREHLIQDVRETKEEPGAEQGMERESLVNSLGEKPHDDGDKEQEEIKQQSSSSQNPQCLQPSKEWFSKQKTSVKDEPCSADEVLHTSSSALKCQRKDKVSISTKGAEEKILPPGKKAVVEDISPVAFTDTLKDHNPTEFTVYNHFSTMHLQRFLHVDQEDIDIYTDNTPLVNCDDTGSQSFEVIEEPLQPSCEATVDWKQ